MVDDDPRAAVEAHPPQLVPVILVVVDKDCDVGVRGNVAQALEVSGLFGLRVDGEVKGLAIDRKLIGTM